MANQTFPVLVGYKRSLTVSFDGDIDGKPTWQNVNNNISIAVTDDGMTAVVAGLSAGLGEVIIRVVAGSVTLTKVIDINVIHEATDITVTAGAQEPA